MSLSLFLFILIAALIYCLFLIASLCTPDEIFTTIRDDLAAIPASVKAAYEAVAGVAAALAWLCGPSAFAPKFWHGWFRRYRHKGKRARAKGTAHAKAGAAG